MSRGNLRFIADNMLGSLTRWLRILGYDTAYDSKAEDWMVLRRAELEGRIILTRDHGLHRRALKRGLRSIYFTETYIPDMLAKLALLAGVELSVDFEYTRCPQDNAPLIKVGKNEVKNAVPERVLKLHEDFWRCPRCGKVYWVGTHWKTIETYLSEARYKLAKMKKPVRKSGTAEAYTSTRAGDSGGSLPGEAGEAGDRGIRDKGGENIDARSAEP